MLAVTLNACSISANLAALILTYAVSLRPSDFWEDDSLSWNRLFKLFMVVKMNLKQ